MKAAVVKEKGRKPVYADFAQPAPQAGHCVVRVEASALSQLTRGRAMGQHYSSSGEYPFVAGVDGVGRTEDGKRVYFFGPRAPFGAMAEHTLVAEKQCIALADSLDAVSAAAIANPGMSSWAALTERARFVEGETVCINGATGSSGRLAVQIARQLGAKKIIATGRNVAVLESLRADACVVLSEDEASMTRAFEPLFEAGIDVVLDYLWGASARAMLIAAAKASRSDRPVRFVQIGSLGGAEIALPAAALRASAITLMGSGLGSIAFARLLNSVAAVLDCAAAGHLHVDARAVPLAQIEAHWDDADTRERLVFTP
jgi:NADPH:quinone reductase-like Zn-dependent oxidoreductase